MILNNVENIGKSITQEQTFASNGVNQTYSYADNSLFFALINSTYRDYYYRNVRINLQWYDGYVVGWHNIANGIFSTRIGTSIVDGVANQVMGKSIIFKTANKLESSNKCLDFISNTWSKNCDLISNLFTSAKYTYATGTSLLKLNQSGKDLWLEPLRNDYFYYETDFKGNIVNVDCFVKAYVNTNSSNKDEEQINYFLVENRSYQTMKKGEIITYFDQKENKMVSKKFECNQSNVPSVCYKVHRFVGQATQNVNMAAMKVEKGLNWQDIPKHIQELIKNDYSTIRVNEPIRLPFSDLGCELVKRSRDTSVPNINVGVSLLTNIRAYLEEYELANAFSVRDMWNGQGQVGVPKQLSIGDINKVVAPTVFSDNKMNYQLFDGDPDKQKPVITQFELRVQEWAIKKDDILKKIATTIGMSPKIIASYLSDSSMQKTATQIDSDDDSVIAFVERERGNFEKPFNNLLKRVCRYYAFSDTVEVKFGTPSLISQEMLIKNTDFLYQNGYIDLRDALSRMNPDATENQLDDLERKARKRQEEMSMSQPKEIDDYGSF